MRLLIALLASTALASTSLAQTPEALSTPGLPAVLGQPDGGTGDISVSNALNIVRVSDYALCTGSSDDTVGVHAAFAYAQNHGKKLRIDKGTCRVCPTPSVPVATIVGSNWEVYGEGSASLVTGICDGEFIRVDSSTFVTSYSNFHDFRYITNLGVGNHPNTHVFRFYCNNPTPSMIDAGTCQWISLITIRNVSSCGVRDLLKADKTGWTTWLGRYESQRYGQIMIKDSATDNGCSTGGSDLATYFAYWDSGPGTGVIITGNQMFTNNGGGVWFGLDGDSGVGDIIISHNQMIVNGGVGVKAVGPTDLSKYRQNLIVSNNQLDGTETSVFDCKNMFNVKYFDNNATNSGPVKLDNCAFIRFNNLYSNVFDFSSGAIGFAGTTASHAMFSFKRADRSATFSQFVAPRLVVWCQGVVSGVGTVWLKDEYAMRMSGVTGTNASLFVDPISSEVKGGTAAAATYLSASFDVIDAGTSTGTATFNATFTGTPLANSTLKCDVNMTGDAGYLTP